MTFKLAQQGLNVVIVSLDKNRLKLTIKQLKETISYMQFCSVECFFSPWDECLKQINETTKDINSNTINNGGFLVTGFFDEAPLAKLLANMECNASATLSMTNHFLLKMVYI